MSQWPAHADIREVGPRDGLQNEATVPIERRIELIDALSRTGLRRIEAAAFVSPKAIPPMAGAAEVMAGITRAPDVVYSALVPNPKGAELAVAAGADELELVVSASETHNRKNVNRSVAESLVGAHDVVATAHAAGVEAEAIVSTAFGGAWTTIVGVLALAGDKIAVDAAARNDVWLAYPMSPAPGQRWIMAVWLALGMAGVIGQLTITAKNKK